MKKIVSVFLIFLSLLSAEELNLKELIARMQVQRDQIKSYSAEVINTVEGAFIQGKKAQQGKIYFQAPGKIRSEVFGEVYQLTLTVKDKTFILDKFGNINEIKNDKGNLESQLKDPLELFNKFDFTIQETEDNTIKLIGLPKSAKEADIISSKIFSKIVIYLDKEKYLAKEIRIHDRTGKEIAKIETEYSLISDLYFPVKTITKMNLNGSVFQVGTVYKNIHINEKLNPDLFELSKIKAEILDQQGVQP